MNVDEATINHSKKMNLQLAVKNIKGHDLQKFIKPYRKVGYIKAVQDQMNTEAELH